MPDWTKSMQQTFEYYIVDPGTWKDTKRLDTVKSCTITRDADAETLGSATIDVDESVGEAYIRVYLVTIQNGVRERFPLGTFLVQTPSSTFDGKVRSTSMEAYTPLMELKENYPPLGYYIPLGDNVMSWAHKLTTQYVRAPVVEAEAFKVLYSNFISNTDDTWLSFITDLAAYAEYHLDLDDMGRVIFSPNQDTASMQPVWAYDDSNSSILQPSLTIDHDLYGIPNVVEVVWSDAAENYYAKVVNDDPNSPTSTVNRGREISYRETNPSKIGDPTNNNIQTYAKQLLRDLSTVEYTITYTHGYCPARLNDCVRLNYSRAGATNLKAKIVSQTIKCEPGCPVTEKAVYTTKLWG